MRNLLKIFVIVAAVVILTDCNRDATYLTSDSKELTLTKTGGKDSVALHSDGAEFQLVSSPEWVDVALKDSTMFVEVKENMSGSPRSGNIVVKNGSKNLSLPISQGSVASYMTVSRNSVTIGQNGEPDTLSVKTDGSDLHLENIEGIQTEFKNGVLTLKSNGNQGSTRKTKARLVCDSIAVDLLVVETGAVCSRCKGSGKVTCYICRGEGMTYCPYMPCRTCNGRGKTNCPECKGKGK